MLNFSDLKTDLQMKFEQVDVIEIPKLHLSTLNKTIKTLTKLLNIRIRTDIPQLSINHFQDSMTQLITYSKTLQKLITEKQSQSLQDSQRQSELENRLEFLEKHASGQIKELSQLNDELQKKVDQQLNLREQIEDSKIQYKELELKYKQLKHDNDQLKSQNSNLNSLIKQLKQEKNPQIDKKLATIKEEITDITQSYQQKLEKRDDYIDKLEREIGLLKSELSMSEDYKLLSQSSKKSQC